jgi:hypothetical protein
LYRTSSYKINSSRLCIGVTVEEKQMSECTPIFSRFGQMFSSRFLGICCYFWSRWLNLTS